MLLALGAFMNRSKVLDWSMGSLGVAWYARLHPRGAGASAGGPEGPGVVSGYNFAKNQYSFAKKPRGKNKTK